MEPEQVQYIEFGEICQEVWDKYEDKFTRAAFMLPDILLRVSKVLEEHINLPKLLLVTFSLPT